ncbi:LysR family transcriptional regulator [Pseudooceanicola sp. CBS1P-1]|uniref:LysR family transcriptional regulator n=1 Tax=Pseudooceanicola albus TaxID=2692189 RepID=A0A6L7G4W9_9RHOB|nr:MULTISPECIES: LysR substrate-binding domain-containing protein [Pseudooceanicola]MBT9385141.1 LysR family transcriptional regulator [Pseudooceanicola endophyticus]MXN18567.1 LysR family transcriptional regulator [Pseudooceanicola albus]
MANPAHLPLGSLRTFEVAARHLSFHLAAAELNVSDSAISHQIRKLEGVLGFALFRKAGRGVQLTEAGEIFARDVSASLRQIYGTALRLAESGVEGGRLDLLCPPMFASGWLSRNLADFCDDHPKVECHIRLADNPAISEQLGEAIGITFGTGDWPGLVSTLLSETAIAPVCAPALLNRIGHPLRRPADLAEVVLLHWDNGEEWRRWLALAGIRDTARFARNVYCSDLGTAIDLAQNGVGCALASDTLARGDLASGRLMRPFRQAIRPNGGWYVTHRPEIQERPVVRLFLGWLLTRFGQGAAEPGG